MFSLSCFLIKLMISYKTFIKLNDNITLNNTN